MDELIRQIRRSLEAELYYLALFGVLALPDICGALGSDNGRASGSKYRDWLITNVPSLDQNAEAIYGLRCSLLHQGNAQPQGHSSRVAFTYPFEGVAQFHNVITRSQGTEVVWFSIPMVVDEITQAVEEWMERFGGTVTVKRNLKKFARFRPEGLLQHIEGPVIA